MKPYEYREQSTAYSQEVFIMNEVMNAILSRRSIRKFTEQPIPDDVLRDIVDAALHAPSGMGKQTWQFTVITNKEVISRLADAIGKELDRKGYDI